ncbi:MAG: hypothetical protein O3C40_22605 [Planctomycetota bacterium]|nr:hypothetical protein [Planctomycetota bacterium]
MTTKAEGEARKLADVHYNIEPGITEIYRVTGSAQDGGQADEPIILLEVNENTIPSGIMPLSFGPSPAIGFEHSSIIIEVTPDEFESIKRLDMPLPNGWRLGDLLERATSVEN